MAQQSRDGIFPIEAGTCVLRPFRLEDREPLVNCANNRQVWRNMRDLFPFPYTPDDADAWLSKAPLESPVLHCAITVSDELAGGIGLTMQGDVFARTAEIGYWLGERFWGRGIATDAVRAFTKYGFQNFNLQRMFAGVFAWNPASMRVLQKAGFIQEGTMRHEVYKDGQAVDRVIYGVTRAQFEALELRRNQKIARANASLSIRQAITADLDAVNEIYNEAVLTTTATFDTEPKTAADRLTWFESHGQRHPVLVAVVDGRVVGWSSLTEYSPRRAYDHTAETSVYVKSEFRGRGIGRALQEAIIDEARRLKFHTLIARVTAESSESMRLHESCGFERVGTLREVGCKFGRILDVHFLQMMLN